MYAHKKNRIPDGRQYPIQLANEMRFVAFGKRLQKE